MLPDHVSYAYWRRAHSVRRARVGLGSRLLRALAMFAVVALMGWAGSAFSQEACTTARFSDGGYNQDVSFATACAEFEVWFEGNGGGREVTSCTASAAGGSASVMNSGGVPGATATWTMTALPSGCTAEGGGGTGSAYPGYPACPTGASCTLLLLPSAFVMTAEDGFAWGAAIFTIWGLAFGWKASRKALDAGDSD